MHCYSCGKLSDHYSKACPHLRKGPRSVTIAGIFALTSRLPYEEASTTSGSGKAIEE